MTYNYRDDPILGSVLAYWDRKRGARSMPSKRDMDPTEIPPELLPNLQIIDVIDGGTRFRYRLVGTALVQAFGEDYTGKHTDEIFLDERLRFIQEVHGAVCKSKLPLFACNQYQTIRNIDLLANRIFMPLSDDGLDVHHILGVVRLEFAVFLNEHGLWGGAKLDPLGQYVETIRSAMIEGRH
jgi:hypothetical protein